LAMYQWRRCYGQAASLRRRPCFPLCRSNRAAAARRVPAVFWLQDGGLYRDRLLYNDGDSRYLHGCNLLGIWPCATFESEYPGRSDPYWHQLYLLAEFGFCSDCRLFIRAICTKPGANAPWAWFTSLIIVAAKQGGNSIGS